MLSSLTVGKASLAHLILEHASHCCRTADLCHCGAQTHPEVQDLLTVLFVFRLRVLFSQNTVSRIDVGSFHCLSHVRLCCPFGIELGSCIFIYTPFGLFSLDLADFFFSLSEYVNHNTVLRVQTGPGGVSGGVSLLISFTPIFPFISLHSHPCR